MMNRSGIETYELLRLDEVALAGYFDLEDTRFEEWYEKNRAVGDRLYSAILDRKIDLVAFRGTEDGRYYSILTRSPKQEGSLQLTDIDCKGPIGHRRLTNQKMLDRSQATRASGMRRDGRRRIRYLTVHGTGNPRCRWIQDATRSEFQSHEVQGLL